MMNPKLILALALVLLACGCVESTISFFEEEYYMPGFNLSGNLTSSYVTAPPPNNSTYRIIEFQCPLGTAIISMNDTHYVCESGKGISIINSKIQPQPKPIRTVHSIDYEENNSGDDD